MKKTIIFGAAFIALTLGACSGNKTETAETQDHITATTEEPATGKVVIETPTFSSVAAPFRTQVAEVLEQYLKLKDALVAEDAETAKTAATQLVELANSMPLATLAEEDQKQFAEEKTAALKESASAIAGTTDLGAQRQQLEQLSEATFALAKAFEAADKKLYYQHCPMAFNDQGAYWISSEKEIRNPYFGKSMLECGTNEEIYTN